MLAYRETADAYGVRVDIRVEHTPGATTEELHRALMLAAAQIKDRHQQEARQGAEC